METFKSFLKFCIENQIARAILQEDNVSYQIQEDSFWQPSVAMDWNFSGDFLRTLVEGFLTPEEKAHRWDHGLWSLGQFQITRLGEVKVLACSQPLQLELFLPPLGESIWEKIWEEKKYISKDENLKSAIPTKSLPDVDTETESKFEGQNEETERESSFRGQEEHASEEALKEVKNLESDEGLRDEQQESWNHLSENPEASFIPSKSRSHAWDGDPKVWFAPFSSISHEALEKESKQENLDDDQAFELLKKALDPSMVDSSPGKEPELPDPKMSVEDLEKFLRPYFEKMIFYKIDELFFHCLQNESWSFPGKIDEKWDFRSFDHLPHSFSLAFSHKGGSAVILKKSFYLCLRFYGPLALPLPSIPEEFLSLETYPLLLSGPEAAFAGASLCYEMRQVYPFPLLVSGQPTHPVPGATFIQELELLDCLASFLSCPLVWLHNPSSSSQSWISKLVSTTQVLVTQSSFISKQDCFVNFKKFFIKKDNNGVMNWTNLDKFFIKES